MKNGMIVLIVFLFLGCKSASLATREPNYFKLINEISIGESSPAVSRRMGPPSEIHEQNGLTQWVYLFAYKSHKVPKLIFWFDSQNKLVTKHINLFKETNDSMKQGEAEKYFSQHHLELARSAETPSGHSVSSIAVLEDRAAGITLQINQSRENEVQSITWNSSADSKTGVASGR